MLYDQCVAFEAIQGHPDACTATQMIEIKLSGIPEKNWIDFAYQLAAYGALAPAAEELVLVLPLQKQVMRWDIRGWAARVEYRDFLNRASKKAQTASVMDMFMGATIRETWAIGCHVKKFKTLADTVRALPDSRRPYQIFLGNPQSSKVSAADADIAAAAQMVAATGAKLYVHTPYIINLCANGEGDWNTELLIKNVQIARAAGCRGVVVHVGKLVKLPLVSAMETMRGALGRAMEHASAECPVLLETPAGQGTETLTLRDEFISFVEEFGDARLRMCIDTCHVFACGHKPLEYLEAVGAKADLVKLIHYNDSAAACGSCVDRHAFMGTGQIGMEGMKAIAEYCGGRGWPMLIE
jgi:deoxyribonuclease-4